MLIIIAAAKLAMEVLHVVTGKILLEITAEADQDHPIASDGEIDRENEGQVGHENDLGRIVSDICRPEESIRRLKDVCVVLKRDMLRMMACQ